MKLKMTGQNPLDGVPFPCGQCLPCRINRRRVWTARLLLELSSFPSASFVTLTYSPEYLPDGGTLVRSDVQKYLKRLRKKVSPRRIRYYAAGEYGGQTGRPHYHLIIYGLDPLADEKVIIDSWPFGMVHIGTCEPDSVQYVAGYVTKKVIQGKKAAYEEAGIIQEFSLMSLKPPLGSDVVAPLAKLTREHPEYFDGPYPTCVRIGGKKYPLGRTLQKRLREALDISHEEHIERFIQSKAAEDAIASSEGLSLLQYLTKASEPKRRRLYARCKLFGNRKL